jgi:hypothetical protein
MGLFDHRTSASEPVHFMGLVLDRDFLQTPVGAVPLGDDRGLGVAHRGLDPADQEEVYRQLIEVAGYMADWPSCEKRARS